MIDRVRHGGSLASEQVASAVMVALILADGDAPDRQVLDRAWPGWSDDVGFVIAADGGARHAPSLGVDIDLWVGDGDSLGEAGLADLAAAGVTIERASTDKDETDTELAVRAAIRRDRGVIIVGALGGPRVDHALANIALLALPELIERAAIIYTDHSRITLLRGPDVRGGPASEPLVGDPGDLVSLIPFGGDATGVTTSGLHYPLRDETLPSGSTRGISNVVDAVGGQVAMRQGQLLVIESPATIAP